MTMNPCIIPFFIAHQGCPHQCVFCNQHAISGVDDGRLSAADVAAGIEQGLSRLRDRRRRVQVAFYGGSFTGLPRQWQNDLLGAVAPFLDDGRVDDIRISTRPDYIDGDVVAFLVRHGVRLVEIGVQSLDPGVLRKSGRGHGRSAVIRAFSLLKEAGIGVGGQLMIGLPGDTTATLLASARQLADLAPEMVRIYPALVLAGSPLADLYRQGQYRPCSLNRAVIAGARLYRIFQEKGIRVIRMGLQPSASLEAELIAGPYHPAFGELVLSRLFFQRVRRLCRDMEAVRLNAGLQLALAPADQSLFRGQANASYRRLTELGLLQGVEVVYPPDQVRGEIYASALQKTRMGAG